MNNYNNKNKSYEILFNLKYIENDLNFNDINDIIKSKNICDKFEKIINIYNKMLPVDEIKIIYNIDSKKEKIKIFGDYFVRNNKNICSISYEQQKFELNEFFDIRNVKKNELEIKLKGIRNVTNMNGMFMGCETLMSLGENHYEDV